MGKAEKDEKTGIRAVNTKLTFCIRISFCFGIGGTQTEMKTKVLLGKFVKLEFLFSVL